jgi:cytochrome c oxidase subunit 2
VVRFSALPRTGLHHRRTGGRAYFFLIALTAFFSLLIAPWCSASPSATGAARPTSGRPPIYGSLALELTWTLIPLAIVAVIFFWSADLYVTLSRVPEDAIEVNVVGKRWMWKLQHMTGQREINELHVPVGVPVKLALTSEDVIHSFFVPAFRVKKDAVPGRYATAWFQATKPGPLPPLLRRVLRTRHSNMIGTIVVMEPAAFPGLARGRAPPASLASAGEKLFQDLACVTCHKGDSGARGTEPGRPLRAPGRARRRLDRDRRRDLHRESIVAPSPRWSPATSRSCRPTRAS